MIDDPNRPEWKKNFFVGMAAPVGAMCALLPLYLSFLGVPIQDSSVAPVILVYVVGIAFLMVSTIPTYSGKTMGKYVPRQWVLPIFVLSVAAFGLLVSFPWEMLTPDHGRLPADDPAQRDALPQAGTAGQLARSRGQAVPIRRRAAAGRLTGLIQLSPVPCCRRGRGVRPDPAAWRENVTSSFEVSNPSWRPKLVLASASPRRLALLQQGGIEPDALLPADVDETPLKNEGAKELAKRLSRSKAEVARRIARTREDLQDSYILSADTVVVAGERILPKAEVVDEAAACLRLLSGRQHRVYTSICLITPKDTIRERLRGDAGALQAPVAG